MRERGRRECFVGEDRCNLRSEQRVRRRRVGLDGSGRAVGRAGAWRRQKSVATDASLPRAPSPQHRPQRAQNAPRPVSRVRTCLMHDCSTACTFLRRCVSTGSLSPRSSLRRVRVRHPRLGGRSRQRYCAQEHARSSGICVG